MATNDPDKIQKVEVKEKPTKDIKDGTEEGGTQSKEGATETKEGATESKEGATEKEEVKQKRRGFGFEASPPTTMESFCLLRMAQRISWAQTEKMIMWYKINEKDAEEMESAISLLIYLRRQRMLRTERFRQALEYAENTAAIYYLDILDEYKNREDIRRKTSYAKNAASKLLFFLKKELTLADVCKISVFISTKPKKCLDFLDVIEALVAEHKISWQKEKINVMLVKIGRIELARRFMKMDWSFIEVLKDEWFKYGMNCAIDDLKSRDFPDNFSMDVGELEEKKGIILDGEDGMGFNLN